MFDQDSNADNHAYVKSRSSAKYRWRLPHDYWEKN